MLVVMGIGESVCVREGVNINHKRIGNSIANYISRSSTDLIENFG